MEANDPSFPVATLDTPPSGAGLSWETAWSSLLDFSLTIFTSHHCTSLYFHPAEREVITLHITGGKKLLQPFWKAKAIKPFTLNTLWNQVSIKGKKKSKEMLQV